MSEILKLEKVCKRFGGVIASEDVSFSLFPGEIRGLIGPNGAGKSTLMNQISGIYNCDSGNIWFEGKDITLAPPAGGSMDQLSAGFSARQAAGAFR